MAEPDKKILVLFAHPSLEESRVNKQVLALLSNMEHVTVRDLYELYPEYELDRQEEQIALIEHDVVIFQHPLYWYSAPPMIKHWIDEVLEFNWAYGPRGTMLKGKWMMNSISAGGSPEAYEANGSNHYSIREFLRPFEQTARLCGMHYLPPFAIMSSYRQTEETIQSHLSDLERLVDQLKSGTFDLKAYEQADFINEVNPANE